MLFKRKREAPAAETTAGEKGQGFERYFAAGQTWEDEIHRTLRRSRNRAWGAAAISSGFTAMSLGALLLLIPLKSFEPYVVEVDKTTGFIEIARALKPGAMSENEAVTVANIVRYVRARETYNPRELKANYDLAQLYSTSTASKELRREFEPSNPNAKNKVLGPDVRVEVNIKSVSFLNKTTASVRFSTLTKRQDTEQTEHWVAVIKFKYTSAPLENVYRFDNPLGFQATEYRRDQETLPDAPAADRVLP